MVTPASTDAFARRSALSAVSAAGSSFSTRTGSASAPKHRCTWQLTSPGRSVQPERLIRLPRGARASSTTDAMRPPSTTTARPRTGSAPVPSISDAPTNTRLSIAALTQTLRRGSSVSRSPSPSRLIPSTVTRMARPGKVASHQAVER